MDTRSLTWDKAAARWLKVYRGRKWYGQRGVKKSDRTAYQQALNAFQEWRSEVDADLDAHKPHAEQYQQAIGLRQAMLNWLLHERENEAQYDQRIERFKHQRELELRAGYADVMPPDPKTYTQEHDALVKEVERLKTDFAKAHPPELDTPGTLPISPIALRPIAERDFWAANIKALKSHERWIGTTDHAKTVGAGINAFLEAKKQKADSKQLAYGWYSVMRYHLDHFRTYAGAMATAEINGTLLSGFHAELLNKIRQRAITTTYAKGILATVKALVRWLWEQETIESLPRNLGKLAITADDPVIKTITRAEIKTLLGKATDRTRLLVLLMLNCGMTGKDISDLTPGEVRWTEGRIVRKRSKTKRQKTVPIVDYKLWGMTFDLLLKYGRQEGERVFTNKHGLPLRRWEPKPSGKPRNVDNVRGVWARLTEKAGIAKPLKLLRKTSPSILAEHPTYGRFAFLFLGHSPKSIAERHYVETPQALFDEAVAWLGKELGIK